MQSEGTRTRRGGAHGGRPREGVVYHTAVCRVHTLPGIASYRMNESHGLGHCRKYAISTTCSGSIEGKYLGMVQRSGQEYVFPPGNFISLKAHGCGSQEGEFQPAIWRVKNIPCHTYVRAQSRCVRLQNAQ
jgi:hypothetical protein